MPKNHHPCPAACRLQLTNKIDEVEKLEPFMAEVAGRFGIPDMEVMSLQLAVEEAVVNVINYAYPEGTEGTLELTADGGEGNSVVFTLMDEGKPFDPTLQAEADITTDVEERPIGGLGIHLIRQIMTRVDYERKDGHNILRMTKQLLSADS